MLQLPTEQEILTAFKSNGCIKCVELETPKTLLDISNKSLKDCANLFQGAPCFYKISTTKEHIRDGRIEDGQFWFSLHQDHPLSKKFFSILEQPYCVLIVGQIQGQQVGLEFTNPEISEYMETQFRKDIKQVNGEGVKTYKKTTRLSDFMECL